MLFFVSLFIVFISSYLAASVFSLKNDNNSTQNPCGFLYTLIIMFAQVVLTFEILSLFKAINIPNVLILNMLFFCLSVWYWNKNKRPLYKPLIKKTLKKIFNALKRDKILMIMAFGYVFFIITVIILDSVMPVGEADALSYHLNRASYWMHQGSLNHFVITDDRNLIMPINSEIVYLWNLLFFKNDYGLYFVSFIGYIASIFCIYNILEFFNFTKRRILWTIFIVSSFASVMAEVSSLETDILLAGLILSSITLFLYALKNKDKYAIFYSSLVYALAMGTKSPAIISFPGVFLLMVYFAYFFRKKEAYKPILTFLCFLFINFMIFSSYNYILNFLQYGDFLGSESAKAIHGFRGGIKAFVANYIRYLFMLFDFSGFRYSEYVGEHIINAKLAIFSFLHIPEGLGVEMSDNNVINNRFLNVKVGAGILGFLLFLPALGTSLITGFVQKNNKKIKVMLVFALTFFVNVFCLSFSIAYMVFSVRFLTFFIVVSSPIVALTYMKKANIFKIFILFFVMSYFLIMSVNLSGRQFKDILSIAKKFKTFQEGREHVRCALYTGYEGEKAYCHVRELIKKMPKGTKIAYFGGATNYTYLLDMMNSHGYKIDTMLPELADSYDYSDYDYVITTDKILISTVLLHKTKDTKINYKIDKKGRAYLSEYVPFSCVYETHENEIYSENKKNSVIMDSRCFIDYPFFEQKGYKVVSVYNFVGVLPQDSNFITIYKNKAKQN